MRVLVCGDRNWTNRNWIAAVLLDHLDDWHQRLNNYSPTVIIEGDANGADKLSGEIAGAFGLGLEVYPAKWFGCFCGHSKEEHTAEADEGNTFWCNVSNCSCAMFSPQGKVAGPLRNEQMLVEGKPDYILAFHNQIELSKGTANMIRQAQKANVHGELWAERGLIESW